jgi:hypothetical protein
MKYLWRAIVILLCVSGPARPREGAGRTRAPTSGSRVRLAPGTMAVVVVRAVGQAPEKEQPGASRGRLPSDQIQV